MTGKRGWRTSVACISTPAAEVSAGTYWREGVAAGVGEGVAVARWAAGSVSTPGPTGVGSPVAGSGATVTGAPLMTVKAPTVKKGLLS